MRGEYGCNTLHPGRCGSQVLCAKKMTAVRNGCQSYHKFIGEGGVCIPTEDITLPFWREIHTYTYAWRTTRSKSKHWDPRLCTSTRSRWPKLTSTYFIRWEMNFCQKQLKSKHTHMLFTWNGPPLIECFLFQTVVGNLILIKVVRAQAYIPSFKQKHAKTLTDTNLKQPLELIYRNVYNTEIHGEVTYEVVGISLYKRLHINMGATKCFTKKWKMHDLLRSWNSGLFPFLFQFGNEPREDLRHARQLLYYSTILQQTSLPFICYVSDIYDIHISYIWYVSRKKENDLGI